MLLHLLEGVGDFDWSSGSNCYLTCGQFGGGCGFVCVVRCQGSPWFVEGQVRVAGISETNVTVGRCCRRVFGVSFSAGDSRPGIANV